MSCSCKEKLVVDVVVRKQELVPEYAHDTDDCLDLKVDLRNYIDQSLDDLSDTKLAIPAGHTIKVHTGLKISVPERHVMMIFPRSSTGLKLNCMLANTVGIIDSGYRDEVMLLVHNYGESAVYLEHGQRIAQFMVLPVPNVELVMVDDDDTFRQNDRCGGLGSTGK